MTSREVCKDLGITRRTLTNWVNSGRIQRIPPNPFKQRDRLMFDRSEVERFKADVLGNSQQQV